jgi:hypothetical protein
MNVERIQSGLLIKKDNSNEPPKVLVSDFIETAVYEDRIVYSDLLTKVHDYMNDLVKDVAETVDETWMLYMAYAGRCWVLESKDSLPALSYIDYPTKSDWQVVGIDVKSF